METMISVNGVKMTVRQFYSQTHYDQDGDELILIGAGISTITLGVPRKVFSAPPGLFVASPVFILE